MTEQDVLVVGAGFAGAVLAERCARSGLRVLVVDRRRHIGGNAYDYQEPCGVRVHRYGPHLFHTNSDRVRSYLSRFTDWWPYEHRVLADVDGRLVPLPINRTTLNVLYGMDMTEDDEVARFLAARAEPTPGGARDSEQVVVGKVGRELYEKFFRGYTTKQWGRDPSELAPSVCARIPVRHDVDDRYFADRFQALPADGYTAMFERMLDHPDIEVRTGTAFADLGERRTWRHLIWTGPIDEYFEHRFGKLPYRSLRFERRVREVAPGTLVQPVATVNYPDADVPYTRVTEFNHLTAGRHGTSVSLVEYPSAEGDPYYPVPADEHQRLYKRYQRLALDETGTTFAGRLGSYRYFNMDQVVAQALAVSARLVPHLLARD